MFSKKDGFPIQEFPEGWRGESGLYAVGFTKRGIFGASMDAKKIAQDIFECSRKSYQAHRHIQVLCMSRKSGQPYSRLLECNISSETTLLEDAGSDQIIKLMVLGFKGRTIEE